MKNEELQELKKRFLVEKNRIERIKELLNDDEVREYLIITKTKECEIPSDSFIDIINRILKEYSITESNGIYVCTGSFYDNGFADDNYSPCYNFLSSHIDLRVYRDIETDHEYKAINQERSYLPTIANFEKDKIILNPYNKTNNRNGYDEVRLEFFNNLFLYGNKISKKLILKKYPRL